MAMICDGDVEYLLECDSDESDKENDKESDKEYGAQPWDFEPEIAEHSNAEKVSLRFTKEEPELTEAASCRRESVRDW